MASFVCEVRDRDLSFENCNYANVILLASFMKKNESLSRHLISNFANFVYVRPAPFLSLLNNLYVGITNQKARQQATK